MVARSVRDAEVPGSSPGTPTVSGSTVSPERIRGAEPDWSLDIPIAPDAVVQRIARAINLPKKRLLGLLKTERETGGVAVAQLDGGHVGAGAQPAWLADIGDDINI